MAQLEEILLEQLKPEVLNIVNEYAESSEEVREFLLRNVNESIKEVVEKYVNELGISIRTINITLKDGEVVSNTDLVHEQFEDVLFFAQLKIPLLLTGPAGAGKNVIVKQVAKSLNLHLYRCTSPQDNFEFKGYKDMNGIFQTTEFYNAFTKGGIFLLDEMDTSISNALVCINDAISNGEFEFTSGVEKMHEDFRIIATANTWGNGRSFEYIGRNRIDGATLDRFVGINVTYDKSLEQTLYPDNDILEVFWNLREAADDEEIRQIFSTRGIKYSYTAKCNGLDQRKIVKYCVIKSLQKDDLNVLLDNISINRYENKFFEALMDVYEEM